MCDPDIPHLIAGIPLPGLQSGEDQPARAGEGGFEPLGGEAKVNETRWWLWLLMEVFPVDPAPTISRQPGSEG